MNENTMNKMLSQDDREYLQKFGDLAFENPDYEFECILNYPSTDVTNFSKVLGLCREKTCSSNWKIIREKSITLDIRIIGTQYRVTIFGKHYIDKFFKTNSLEDLPRGSWNVIKKSWVKFDDEDEFYDRVVCNLEPGENEENHATRNLEGVGCKLNLKSEEQIDPTSTEFTIEINRWNNSKKQFRLKNRYSFLVDSKYSVDLTAVRSTRRKAKTLRDANTFNAKEDYEIEIEYLPNVEGDIKDETLRNEFDINSWCKLMNSILCEYLDSWHVYSIDSLCGAENQYYNVLSGMDKSDIEKLHNYSLNPQVVTLTMSRLRVLERDAKDYYVCPKSDGLRMNGFIAKDGELYLFGSKSTLWHPTGCHFDSEHYGTIFDGELCRQTVNNEHIAHYLVFDCYWADDVEIRQKAFSDRRAQAITIIESGFTIDESPIDVKFNIQFKKFISCKDDLFAACRQCFDDIEKGIYENDGLIFTPDDKVGGSSLYNNRSTGFVKSGVTFDRMLKWKDHHYNSIDFRVQFVKDTEAPRIMGNDYVVTKLKECRLYSSYSSDPLPFTYTDYQKFDALSEADKKLEIAKNKEYEKRGGKEREFIPHSPDDAQAKTAFLPIVNGRVRCFDGKEWSGSTISHNDIVEMIYRKHETPNNRWVPIRVRRDKSRPNHFGVAIDIWRSFHTPVSLEIMKGEEPVKTEYEEQDIYYNVDAKRNKPRGNLRDFHNQCCKDRIFASTIGQTDGKCLLDLGSGKAGDLPRYISHNVSEVVGVDNSVDNLHNSYDGAYRRLFNSENRPRKAMFLAADVGKPLNKPSSYHGEYQEIIKSVNPFAKEHHFDAATVFFALHYFFKDTKSMRTFLKNVADNVKVGGYFGGCCYDGKVIFEKLKESNGILPFNVDGTEMLRIIQNYKADEFPPTEESLGNEIRVLVQSIGTEHTEYLVNFDLLKKELQYLGFQQVEDECQNFEVYYRSQNGQGRKIYHMTEDEKKVSFLNRAFVFKRTKYATLVEYDRDAIQEKV